MNDQLDTLEVSQTMADIAESSQKLVADFLGVFPDRPEFLHGIVRVH